MTTDAANAFSTQARLATLPVSCWRSCALPKQLLVVWSGVRPSSCRRLLTKFVGQFADPVDRDGDRIDRLLHHADADRSPAADEVARQQRHVVRDLADQRL